MTPRCLPCFMPLCKALYNLFKQIEQHFEPKYFLSDSEDGIKIQIRVALIRNLLFEVPHNRIKEAEDFITMVMVAEKNSCSYVSLEKFSKHGDLLKKYILKGT